MFFELASMNVISADRGLTGDDFWVNFHVDISEIGGYGAETFSVNAVGTARIKRIAEHENVIGRGLIIRKEFDEIGVQTAIEELLEKIAVNSWDEFCIAFEKYFDRL